MDVYVKTTKIGVEVLVAACDAEIVGRVFEEDDLSLTIEEDFYCGECMPVRDCSNRLIEATILNLVGENVVAKAIELGLVHADNVLRIGGTVHAQMVRL
jgi:hypothetical protein